VRGEILYYWATPHGGVELIKIDIGRNIPNIIVRTAYIHYTLLYTLYYITMIYYCVCIVRKFRTDFVISND